MSKNTLILILLPLLIVFTVFLVIPEYNKYQELNMELSVKAAQLDPENTYYDQIESAYKYIQENGAVIDKIDDALPENPDTARVIYFLQQKAGQSGLALKNTVVSQSPSLGQSQAPRLQEMIISLSASGSYDALNKFLVALEKSDRIFEITNVSFTAPALATQILPNRTVQTTQPPFEFIMQIKTHSY